MDVIKQETDDLYQKLYAEKLSELNSTRPSTDNELIAQKHAIKETALQLFQKLQTTDKFLIWAYIYRAHVARKSGIDIAPETIQKVISADQSWKKSSGHAFEEMVKDLGSKVLQTEGIRLLLQRDLSIMINTGEVKNEERDIIFLRTNMSSNVFDLYTEKNGYIYGCVQAKTSIRDRVTRDREPSTAAMAHFFWSIVFVLDGDFLRLPKFMNMVRGESDEFIQNGWHGLYAFSLPDSVICDRIYKLDHDLNIFKEHAVKAYHDWSERRQWFDNRWKADIEAVD